MGQSGQEKQGRFFLLWALAKKKAPDHRNWIKTNSGNFPKVLWPTGGRGRYGRPSGYAKTHPNFNNWAESGGFGKGGGHLGVKKRARGGDPRAHGEKAGPVPQKAACCTVDLPVAEGKKKTAG